MKKLYFLLLTVLSTSAMFGQVFITELADPNDNANARFIELYNAGSTAVDLSSWRIDKYTNDSPTVSQTLNLTGSIAAGGFYIISTGADTNTAVFDSFGVTPNLWDGATNNVAGSNGDDNLELYDGTNTLIDQFGIPGEDGTGTDHEFEDGRAERNASVTMGNSTWDFSEWNIDSDAGTGDGPQNVAGGSFDPGTWIGTATGPLITISSDVSGLDYFEGNGPSAEGTFTVEGINLTNDIIVTTTSTEFQISLTSGGTFSSSVTLPQNAGTVANTTVYIILNSGLTTNTYSENITAASTGALDVMIAANGEVTASTPQFSVFGTPDSFNYTLGNGPSNEDSIFVEGLFLTNDITVTAPMNFEVSLTSGSGFASSVVVPQSAGTVANTEIFIRLIAGLGENAYSGDLTVTSAPAADQTVALTGNVFGAATNALALVGIYDGPLTGGVPKGIELVALVDIADLSIFGISSITNGAGSSAGTIEYNFPADAITAGTSIFLATESTEFSSFFGFTPDYVDGVVGINGDDSIELYEGGTIIDTFGDVNMDGTGEAWEYLDGWAKRVSGTGPDGTFVIANWTFSGANAFDGETTNASAATPYPLGAFLSVDSFDFKDTLILHPNPTNTGTVTISTKSNSAIAVTVFDILGKQVLSQTIQHNTLDVSNLNTGVYILNIKQDGAIATKRLVIQ